MKEDSRYYNCQYCSKEFEPKRRRIQKFCSDTCRVKSHHAKKFKTTLSDNENQTTNAPTKIEKVSPAGIANAALGSAFSDGLKSFITKESNKPATKGDLKQLESKLKRYHKVNLPPRHDGATPYFDMETNEIIYSFSILLAKQ